MWRRILSVVLLPSLTTAQADFKPNGSASRQPLADSSSTVPKVAAYLSLSELRQGTKEKAAVTFDRPSGFVTSPRSPVPGIVPVSLVLQPEEGLTIGSIDYPKTFDYRFQFRAKPTAVFQFPWQQIEFKLGATRNATPGPRTVTGQLTFQTVSDTGVSELRQMDVRIPVTIVEHEAKISRSDFFPGQSPSGSMNPAFIVLMIVLAPIIIPLWFLACTVGGQDCSC